MSRLLRSKALNDRDIPIILKTCETPQRAVSIFAALQTSQGNSRVAVLLERLVLDGKLRKTREPLKGRLVEFYEVAS